MLDLKRFAVTAIPYRPDGELNYYGSYSVRFYDATDLYDAIFRAKLDLGIGYYIDSVNGPFANLPVTGGGQ